ncbi:hypothetical protein [Magnetococcus sp. PR-3]|uniref:hypothetical protein n=1 Tax=Magnetococcus sp. PR-3 TaxID=3120355 RepID=UPI002FCE09A6
MGTQKFIRLNGGSGQPEEAYATDRSKGRKDAGKIVALDRHGKLSKSMLPAGCCRCSCRHDDKSKKK